MAEADALEHNRRLWERWTALHLDSPEYDFEGFRAGRSTLRPVEFREIVPRVAGRTLLHLQCHVGLDTLSLARAGAAVTGLDFSPASIDVARALSAASGVAGRFVCGEVGAAPAVAGTGYDVVYTSYGVLSWLPDLASWARTAFECLRPGGTFYMVENHPIQRVLRPRTSDDVGNPVDLPYFSGEGAVEVIECGSYARYEESQAAPAHYWMHTLGQVVSSLAEAGLVLRYLHEHPATTDDSAAESAGGPELFSLEAQRP